MPGQGAGKFLDAGLDGQHFVDETRYLEKVADLFGRFLTGHGSPAGRSGKGNTRQGRELRGIGLGRCHADFRARQGPQMDVSFSGD